MNPLDRLKNRVLGKKTAEANSLTHIIGIMSEVPSVGDYLGRTFEVRDPKGNIVYVVEQKAITMPQLTLLEKHLNILNKLKEQEAKKNAKKGRRGR